MEATTGSLQNLMLVEAMQMMHDKPLFQIVNSFNPYGSYLTLEFWNWQFLIGVAFLAMPALPPINPMQTFYQTYSQVTHMILGCVMNNI